MLTDPTSILKVQGALQKLADVEPKLCDAMLALTTLPEDKGKLQAAINLAAASSMKASETVPPP